MEPRKERFLFFIRKEIKTRKSEEKFKQHNISFKRLIMSFVQHILFKRHNISFKRLIMWFVQENQIKTRKEIKTRKPERKLKQENQRGN